MSLNSILSIARSALLTHQKAQEVTGHNISNAYTEGYTRQRLRIQAAPPLVTSWGTVGRGVVEQGVERIRDRYLDATYRAEAGSLGRSDTLRTLLAGIESIFGEPSESGLAAALDAFFSAFAELANDPSSLAARTLVQSAGRRLARQFNLVAGGIAEAQSKALAQLRGTVDEVNSLARRIAQLNVEILAGAGIAQSAPDLADQRDQLLDRLSQLATVRVLHNDNGTLSVVAGDTMLVEGGMSRSIAVQAAGSGFQLITDGNTPFAAGGGQLDGLLEFLNVRAGDLSARLDQLAAALVSEVNALHQTGVTPGGASGTNFFDPAGTTALTIALDPAIAASALAVAAGNTAAPGDNSVALAISQLRGTGIAALGGASAGEYLADLVSYLGNSVRDLDAEATVARSLVAAAEMQRQSVSGVSLDEELTALMVHQQAYTAAARVVSVANEMMDDLLHMV
jgi:flagellar hook-associated protein 1 FlgK